MKKYYIIVFALAYSWTITAQEEKSPSVIKALIEGFLELGGDEVAEVFFTNGETQSIKAGQGATLSLGAQLQLPSISWLSVDATVGIKYVTTAADNAHIRLTRIPIHIMANYLINKDVALSVGVANHQAIKLYADGLGDDMPFDAAFGPRCKVAYKGIGLTYTHMTYKFSSEDSFSASAIGLGYTFVFGKK